MLTHASWNVRPVRADEFDGWTRLFRGYADFYNWPTSDEHQRQIWKWIHEEHHVEALVAVRVDDAGNEIGPLVGWPTCANGFARCAGRCADISTICSSTRPHAVAVPSKRCTRRCNAWLGSRGWAIIRWTTADDNYRARSFYDKVATRTTWITYDMTT